LAPEPYNILESVSNFWASMRGRQAWRPNMLVGAQSMDEAKSFNEGAPSLAPEQLQRALDPGSAPGFNEGAPSLAPEHWLQGRPYQTPRSFNEGAPSLAPEPFSGPSASINSVLLQ